MLEPSANLPVEPDPDNTGVGMDRQWSFPVAKTIPGRRVGW